MHLLPWTQTKWKDFFPLCVILTNWGCVIRKWEAGCWIGSWLGMYRIVELFAIERFFPLCIILSYQEVKSQLQERQLTLGRLQLKGFSPLCISISVSVWVIRKLHHNHWFSTWVIRKWERQPALGRYKILCISICHRCSLLDYGQHIGSKNTQNIDGCLTHMYKFNSIWKKIIRHPGYLVRIFFIPFLQIRKAYTEFSSSSLLPKWKEVDKLQNIS